jgi:hypothetical protein
MERRETNLEWIMRPAHAKALAIYAATGAGIGGLALVTPGGAACAVLGVLGGHGLLAWLRQGHRAATPADLAGPAELVHRAHLEVDDLAQRGAGSEYREAAAALELAQDALARGAAAKSPAV